MTEQNINLGGSIKRKFVNPDLQEERDASRIDREELAEFIVGKAGVESWRDFAKDIAQHPELITGFEWYDMTREEKFEAWYKRYNMLAHINRDKYLDKLTYPRAFSW